MNFHRGVVLGTALLVAPLEEVRHRAAADHLVDPLGTEHLLNHVGGQAGGRADRTLAAGDPDDSVRLGGEIVEADVAM